MLRKRLPYLLIKDLWNFNSWVQQKAFLKHNVGE